MPVRPLPDVARKALVDLVLFGQQPRVAQRNQLLRAGYVRSGEHGRDGPLVSRSDVAFEGTPLGVRVAHDLLCLLDVTLEFES